MSIRRLFFGLAAIVLLSAPRPAPGGLQAVALFPLRNLAGPEMAPLVPLFTQQLADKLSDRFDVRLVREREEGESARRRARALGAVYFVTGAVSRIGGTATLDLSIAPVEEPRAARTVVADVPWGVPGKTEGAQLPPAGKRLVLQASARLKDIFFGDERVGEGERRVAIPRPKGVVARTRTVAGEVVSAVLGDVDGDGQAEIVATLPDEILVLRAGGEDPSLKARISVPGGGVVHVDLADADGDGKPDIVISRYAAGQASSDIVTFRGGTYRRIAADLPWFLRSLGPASSEMAGQQSSLTSVFAGPVFRVECAHRGDGVDCVKKETLPLPSGTFLFAFVPVRGWGGTAYAVVAPDGRVRLLDGRGKATAETMERLGGTDKFVEAAAGGGAAPLRVALPPRLIAADLNGDGVDEIVALNSLRAAGSFFEGLRLSYEAEALCFARDGDAVRLAWRTQTIGAPACDLFLEMGGGAGGFKGIGIASRERGKILDRLGEWRVVWVR